MANCTGPSDHETSFEDPDAAADGSECLDVYPSDHQGFPAAPGPTDEQLEAGLRRVLAAIDGLPPKVDARPVRSDDGMSCCAEGCDCGKTPVEQGHGGVR